MAENHSSFYCANCYFCIVPTLNQLLSAVRNPPDKGTSTRAREFTDRQITQWINEVYGYLVTKTVEKGDSIPVTYQMDLGCWPLEVVDAADCECPYVWGDDVRKAVIPEILEIDNNKGITFFGLINKRTRIYLPSVIYGELDDHLRFPQTGSAGYQAQMIGNQTIYLKKNVGNETPMLKVVNVRIIPKDPTLVSFYNQFGEQSCYDADKTPYPIPGDLQGIMVDMIWKRYILPFAQVNKDNSNQENSKALV